MKALWVTERFPPDRGGAAVSAARQVRSLAPRLERLDVLRLDSSLPAGRVVLEDFGPARLYRAGACPEHEDSLHVLTQTAVNLHAAEGYSLVHGFYAVPAGYAGVLAARRCGLPSVVSLRGNDVDRAMFQGSRLSMLLWTLERADVLVSVSQDLLDKARALSGRERAMRVIPNGVDAGTFRPDGPAEAPSRADLPRPWLAFSGELRFKKGLELLLELAERLEAEGRGTLFLLGGARADCAKRMRSWRRGLPAASARLVETAYEREPARLAAAYRSMDLFVFPSLWDGLPNAMLEAMACGKPVLAPAAGAFAETAEAGRSAFLVPPAGLDGFAREALRVLSLPAAELDAVGSAARKRVVERHSPDAERDALLETYRSLCPGSV